MATAQPTRKTYLMFRRYMSGITTACICITIVGSAMADASFETIAFRGSVVWFCIGAIQWVLLKTWSAWEITNANETKGRLR